jgi:hypothetical protein
VPASSCNGAGGCALVAAVSCSPYLCSNGGCASSCRATAECGAEDYCASGACVVREDAGADCAATTTSAPGEACLSDVCRGKHCCAQECSTGDRICHVSGCDSSGACLYPDSATVCGPPESCSNGMHLPLSGCGGDGGCVIATAVSCGAYLCDQQGIGCNSSCTATAQECVVGAYCGGQKCAMKGSPGQPCAASSTNTADQACVSSICSGNCCLAACPADPTTNNCQGSCDATGACTPKACPKNFGCSGGRDCNTACATDADCAVTGFCDPVGATACCTRFSKGDTIYIDGVSGDDTAPCCGAQATPCQTITHAMTMVGSSATSGVILNVSNSDGTTSWTSKETYPIHLGWGVTLTAPSLYFANQTRASDIFQVYAFDVTDTGTVTIQGGNDGTLDDAVHIGFDPALGNQPPSYNYQAAYYNAKIGVNDDVSQKTALPMVIQEAWLNDHQEPSGDQSYDLKVGAGAVVTLGPSPVEIGNGRLINSLDTIANGYHAIYCKGNGAVIQDDPTAKTPVLTVETRYDEYLDVEDGCTVSLTQGPEFGAWTTSPAGWNGTLSSCQNAGQYICQSYCDYLPSNGAIVVVGSGSVTFGSTAMPGAIRCARYGIDAEKSNASGSPAVVVNGATIDLRQSTYCYGYYGYCGTSGSVCAGAMITEGSFSATASTFTHGYLGLFLGPNVISADLSGGGNGGNTFGCNGTTYGGYYNCKNTSGLPTNGGADVVNATGSVAVNAQNATWDDWDSTDNSTQLWTCPDATFSSCTCTGPNCSSYSSPGTPPDRADAITLSTNSLDTTVGAQNTSTCP